YGRSESRVSETPKIFRPLIVTPECSPSKASLPAGGGASAQPHRSAGRRPPRAAQARPDPPSARNPLRCMVLLQKGFIYRDAQARSVGERGKSVLHLFEIDAR